MTILRHTLLLALAVLLAACSTHFDTSRHDGAEGRTIYRLSQQQAFAIAYNAIVEVLPGRKITEVNGPVRGYETYFRFMLDTYTQVVMVIPARGTTRDGETVDGYYFEISGRGSSVVQGQAKNYQLRDAVQAELDELNVAVQVAKVEGRPYEAKGDTRTAGPSGLEPAAPAEKTAEQRLEELRELYERGVITEDEYNSQRTRIIESL